MLLFVVSHDLSVNFILKIAARSLKNATFSLYCIQRILTIFCMLSNAVTAAIVVVVIYDCYWCLCKCNFNVFSIFPHI